MEHTDDPNAIVVYSIGDPVLPARHCPNACTYVVRYHAPLGKFEERFHGLFELPLVGNALFLSPLVSRHP